MLILLSTGLLSGRTGAKESTSEEPWAAIRGGEGKSSLESVLPHGRRVRVKGLRSKINPPLRQDRPESERGREGGGVK